tara:strand:+ start:272 stop:568 length:297 start_codon:yes stop_codon:yes gene_type:complete
MTERLQENSQLNIVRNFHSSRKRRSGARRIRSRKRRSRSRRSSLRTKATRNRSKNKKSSLKRFRSSKGRKTRRDWWNAKNLAGTGLAVLHENRELYQE